MTDKSQPADAPQSWSPETQLVHGGTMRSAFAETSEALFLTQSYVYDSAEQAEERFKSEAGLHLQPLRQPDRRHVRGAHAAAGRCRGRACHGHRHGGRHLRAAVLPQGRRPLGGGAGPVRLLPLRGGGPVPALRHRLHAGRWARHRAPGKRPCAPTPRRSSSRHRPIQPSTWSTSPPSQRSPTPPGALVVVDNVFATPILQKPLKLGADVVVYSATKHIDGQGRCLGGIVLGSQAYVKDHLHNFLKHTGPSLSPFNAWVMLKGLETLPIRVRAQCETAARIADHLADQAGVKRVLFCGRSDYPQAALARRQMSGPGQIVTFELEGGKRGLVPLPQCPEAHPALQQSGRRQEPHHAPRHHHPPAPQARGARRARHLGRHASAVGGPGVLRRSRGRH